MDKRARFIAGAVCTFVGLGSSPLAVSAETTSASLMEEVVVTAQKREENVQDVGIAVSAFSGDLIEQLGMKEGYQVSDQVPNFNFNATGGASSPVAYLNIRGVQIIDFSLANDPSVGVYMDEVYQPAQGAALAQLFDVERVEVLRGPQGTLFGRNITGGLLHTISRTPTEETSGYVSAQYGEFNKSIIEGAASGSLGDTVRGRVAVQIKEQDGWQEEQRTGRDDFGEAESWAARAIFEVDLSDNLLGTFAVHGSDADSTTPARGFYGVLDPVTGVRCSDKRVINSECVNASGLRDPSPHPEEVFADAPRPSFSKASGGSAKFEYAASWGEFVSVTGFENYEGTHGGQVAPHGPFALGFIFHTDVESFSQEFRGVGETMGGGTWAAGAYYYQDEKKGDSATIINTRDYRPLLRQTSTDTWAVFMQVEQPITEKLSVVVGGRYTDETRSLDFITDTLADGTEVPIDFSALGDDDEIEAGELTGKFGLEWRPSDTLMGYASFSRGYKSGGFNPERDVTRLGPVDPEELNAWELGWKSEYQEGRVRFNGAVFVYDFKGYQALVTKTALLPTGAVDVQTRFINLDNADIYGAELELTALLSDNLYGSLGVGLLRTTLNTDDAIGSAGTLIDGKDLPNSPELSLNGILRYAIPTKSGEFALQADFRWQDDSFHGIDNLITEAMDSYAIVNLRAFWRSPDQKWHAEAFVENVGDEIYSLQALYSTSLTGSSRSWGLPQWWGVKFGYDF